MTQTYYVDPTAGSNGSGTSGSPYNSVRNALNALQAAFDAATEDYVINLLAGADTGLVANWTFNSTSTTLRKLVFQASGAARHTGVRGTGYRRTNGLSFIGGGNSSTYVSVEVRGVALYGNAVGGMAVNGVLNCLFDGCAAFDITSNYAIAVAGSNGNPVIISNCLAVACGGTGIGAFHQYNNAGTPSVHYLNCTSLASPDCGFRRSSGTCIVKNCYSGGSAVAEYAGTMTRTNCQHASATVFAGSTASVAMSTANFANVTSGSEDARLVIGSALIGAGNGPANDAEIPVVDFAGDARGGATTDVGFDQLTPYSAGVSSVLLERGYTRGDTRGYCRGMCR